MVIINNCLQETTLNLQINGQCTSPTYILTHAEQMFLELIRQNEQCCASLSKYMLGITQQLNNQQYLIEKLTANCFNNYYDQPVCIPCQVIEPVHQDVRPKELTNNPFIPFYIPKETIKRYNMILYPINYKIEGGFAIIGIPGTWQLRKGFIYNEAGDELSQYLPLIYNFKLPSLGLILERIRCYRIIKNKVEFEYQVFNIKTGVRKTFYGGTGLWNKYSK